MSRTRPFLQRSAAHAQAAELEEDARQWVEARLSAPTQTATPAARASRRAAGDLLREGGDAHTPRTG